MIELPLNFNGHDEVHVEKSQVVSCAEFSVCKPIHTLSIRIDQDTCEVELNLAYRSELPDALEDDPNIRPGGREYRSKDIALYAQGPNVDFHFSSIKDMEGFFNNILDEAKKLSR